jgi:hypothetical protein
MLTATQCCHIQEGNTCGRDGLGQAPVLNIIDSIRVSPRVKIPCRTFRGQYLPVFPVALDHYKISSIRLVSTVIIPTAGVPLIRRNNNERGLTIRSRNLELRYKMRPKWNLVQEEISSPLEITSPNGSETWQADDPDNKVVL